jgi:drug/metabolite transporter (DMT)-like permease
LGCYIIEVLKNIFIGILFAMLWASAAVATKTGVASVQPLVLGNIRFFIAGIFLLSVTYLFQRGKQYRLPQGKEWLQLSVFGFLNTTLYLGLYVYAMKYSAAGIGSLAVSTTPLLIVIFSAVFMGRLPKRKEITGMILGMAGVGLATLPLLEGSITTIPGVVLLLLSMVAVAGASVYYAHVKWLLPPLLINGWQVLLGGIFQIPFTIASLDVSANTWDARFWYSVLWLSLAVSVVGLICWFYLLMIDTVKASFWLFLCPVFGFIYAWVLLGEPITWYTWTGTILVLAGLMISRKT